MPPAKTFAKDPLRSKLERWYLGIWRADKVGARARLRRAATPEQIAFEPELYTLVDALAPELEPGDDDDRMMLAAIAGLAVRVKEIDTGSLARQMAAAKAGPGTKKVSEARFKRLLTLDDPDARFQALRRILALLDGRANLFELADAFLRWDPKLRQRWAYDYYRDQES